MNSGVSSLSAYERFAIGAQVAGGQLSISEASRMYKASRKFIRTLRDMAESMIKEEALHHGNAPVVVIDDAFMERFVVAAALIGICSFRGIRELCLAMFGVAPSLGTIHNILQKAVARAKECNSKEDLSRIGHAAIDEIFQNSKPVLAGVDLATLYIFLLSVEQDRSGLTWWCALEECKEKDFGPHSVIGDGGLGLRKGMHECFPEVPCDSDVFHALQDITRVLEPLEKKALGAIGKVEEIQHARAKLAGSKKNGCNKRLGIARKQEAELLQGHSTLKIINDFLKEEVLNFNEMSFEDRRQLFDWLMKELAAVETSYSKISPLRKKLEGEKETLLAVFGRLDAAIVNLASKCSIDVNEARMMVNEFNGHCYEANTLNAKVRMIKKYGYDRVRAFLEELEVLMSEAFRASSPIENINSILRMYFQQRREIGHAYLELLRFYLNHRIVDRSRIKEREAKSSCERLTGEKHKHWLDMLDFSLKTA